MPTSTLNQGTQQGSSRSIMCEWVGIRIRALPDHRYAQIIRELHIRSTSTMTLHCLEWNLHWHYIYITHTFLICIPYITTCQKAMRGSKCKMNLNECQQEAVLYNVWDDSFQCDSHTLAAPYFEHLMGVGCGSLGRRGVITLLMASLSAFMGFAL